MLSRRTVTSVCLTTLVVALLLVAVAPGAVAGVPGTPERSLEQEAYADVSLMAHPSDFPVRMKPNEPVPEQPTGAMPVPCWGQCSSPWSGDQLGTCNLTICDAGCAITSVAMIFKYYGVNTDPRIMNNYLKSHGGYAGGCSLYWTAPPGCSGGTVTYAGGYQCQTFPCDMNVVNAEVDRGYPCVVEVRFYGGMHFVAITGRDGGTYYINDPAYGDRTTLNARYGSPPAAIYAVHRYHGNVTPPTPSWAASYKAQSYPATMVAGSTATAWVEYTNTGTGHWTHGDTRLGTSSPQDRSSAFYNAGNWISASRPTDVDQSDVAQNQVGRFTFVLKAPATPGAYVEKFKLVQEGAAWFGSEITWTITVTASKGNITGTVRDSYNNNPISGAAVAISGGPTTTTNSAGSYTFTGLDPATYTLNVSKAGYNPASGTAAVTAGNTTTKNFTLTSTDTTPPSVPTGLTAASISPSQINLAWSASTDAGGSGLAGYIVFRNGSEVGRTASASYTDNGLAPNTTYTYTLRAYDNAGNTSGLSSPAAATTQPGSVPIFQDGFANTSYWQALVESAMPGPYPPDLVANHDHSEFPGGNSLQTRTSTIPEQGCLIGHTFTPAFAAAKYESWFFDGTGIGYRGDFDGGTEGWSSYPSSYAVLSSVAGGSSGNCLQVQDGGWTGGFYKEFTSGFAVGDACTLKISTRVPAAGTWGTAPYVFLRFRDGAGNTIGTESKANITADNAWREYTVSATVPAGTASIWIGEYMYLNATSTYHCYVDWATLTTTASLHNSSRQGLQVRCHATDGSLKAIYYLGTYPASPGNYDTYSAGYYKFGDGAWTWPGAACAARSAGWHRFTIDVQPYTGAGNEVKFLIDGTQVATAGRSLDTQTYGIDMVAYGHHYRVNYPGWFDDCAMYASAPVAPTVGTPVALSDTAIRWILTDSSNNEMGFKIHDAAQQVVASAGVSNAAGGAVSSDETGLTPNVQYIRTAKAYNGSLESLATGALSRWTLSRAPTAANVACSRTVGSCSDSPVFTFTAVGGFGAGTVEQYRYAWDGDPTHTWTETEPIWNSGALIVTAPESGTYYLHVKGYNGEGVANGTLDLGPFAYQSGLALDKIEHAWPLSNGTETWLYGKPVTAVLPGAFYIEEPNRSAGIKVVSTSPRAVGDLVDVSGTLGLSGPQRAMIATSVTKTGTAPVPRPLFMLASSVGGMSPKAATPGTTEGLGPYNVGLLVRILGSVTYSNSDDPGNRYFYVSDGSRVPDDGSGHAGVMVRCGSIVPPSGRVSVTGVVSLEVPGKKVIPVIVIRDSNDIDIY